MLVVDEIGTGPAAVVDCAYLITLTTVITREIVAGNNWRNLRVAVLVGLTAVANIVFQAEVVIYAAPTYGLRLAVAAIVGLIMVVGGRVIPSFTSNWLTRQGSGRRPTPLDRSILVRSRSRLLRLLLGSQRRIGKAPLLCFFSWQSRRRHDSRAGQARRLGAS